MIRDDLSNKLIHLTNGDDPSAEAAFLSIVEQRQLIGGSGCIRGRYKCVCFSEAPRPNHSLPAGNVKRINKIGREDNGHGRAGAVGGESRRGTALRRDDLTKGGVGDQRQIGRIAGVDEGQPTRPRRTMWLTRPLHPTARPP